MASKIHFFKPYSITKEIGHEYNYYCRLVEDPDDWICFLDFDTCFLTPKSGQQIYEVVEKYGNDFGLFTCFASRIKNPQQMYGGHISNERDILKHHAIAKHQEEKAWCQVTQLQKHISGMFMLFPKRVWLKAKFPAATKRGTMLGIDNVFSDRVLRAGFKIGRIDGIYLFHYYRLATGIKDRSHLSK